MSLCDTCPKPGSCCKHIHLHGGSGAVSFWADEPQVAVLARMAELGLPFIPTEEASRHVDPATGRTYRTFYYDCPLLGADGRCTEYETRPELCRAYQPKQDRLCILHESYNEESQAMGNMRAKLQVGFVQERKDGEGNTTGETLTMHAVAASKYPEDGSDEDNTYAKFSPGARLEINIANPVLFGQFQVGEKYYVDFTPATA